MNRISENPYEEENNQTNDSKPEKNYIASWLTPTFDEKGYNKIKLLGDPYDKFIIAYKFRSNFRKITEKVEPLDSFQSFFPPEKRLVYADFPIGVFALDESNQCFRKLQSIDTFQLEILAQDSRRQRSASDRELLMKKAYFCSIENKNSIKNFQDAENLVKKLLKEKKINPWIGKWPATLAVTPSGLVYALMLDLTNCVKVQEDFHDLTIVELDINVELDKVKIHCLGSSSEQRIQILPATDRSHLHFQ